MGNSNGKSKSSSRKLPPGFSSSNAEFAQPGQPKVRLSARPRITPIEAEEVSDEVCLTWAPCSKHDKSYEVEMWDLGLQEWILVSTTDDTECTLSNILSGILYRFRVTAITKEGLSSFPSDPSEPFVIDIPGVQIAPYWIQTPPTIVSLTVNQTLTLTAAALGTPAPNFHWYKDDEEIFIRENLKIQTTSNGSQLIIDGVECDDGGLYTCSAINTVGKCTWETTVDLKAKPAFTLPDSLTKPISYLIDELMSLKIPLIAVPEPSLLLEKLDSENEEKVEATFQALESNDKRVWLYFMDNFAIVKFEAATKWHTGKWRLTASNPIGKDEAILQFHVRSEPDPPPDAPEVVDVKEEGIVDLTWRSNPRDEELYEDLQYQLEYNRETWDVWLKGCVTSQRTCTLNDLFPGSYYRFRIRCVCKTGVSEPSPPTDKVFIGRPLEDEVFGLPGGNYPKERGQHRNLFHYGSGIKHTKRFSSLDKDLSAASASAGSTGVAVPNTNSNTASASPFGSKRPRKYSLERDVYYFENNRREEVVNYEAGGKGLGSNVSSKFGLNETETEVYKRSLSDLAGQMVRASQSSLATSRRSQESLDTVISSKRSDATSGTADKYGLNETEREVYRRSLGDLCNQMMRASQTSLNRTSSRTSSLDKVSTNSRRSLPPSGRLSIEDATERDKALIRSSLTDLCVRLKSVSRENSLARTDSRQSSLARIGTRESSLAVPDIEPVPIRNELVQKQHLQPAPQPMIGPIAPPRRSSRSRSRSIEEKHKTTAMVPIGPPLAPLHHPMSPIGEEEAKKEALRMKKYPYWPYSSCTEWLEHDKRKKKHEERVMRATITALCIKIKSVSRENSYSSRLSPYSPYSDSIDALSRSPSVFVFDANGYQSDGSIAPLNTSPDEIGDNKKFSKEETFFLLAFGMPMSLGGIHSTERPKRKVNLFALAAEARRQSVQKRKASLKASGKGWKERKYSTIDLYSKNGKDVIPIGIPVDYVKEKSKSPNPLGKSKSPNSKSPKSMSPSSPSEYSAIMERSISPKSPTSTSTTPALKALKPPPMGSQQYSWESEGYHSGREEDVSDRSEAVRVSEANGGIKSNGMVPKKALLVDPSKVSQSSPRNSGLSAEIEAKIKENIEAKIESSIRIEEIEEINNGHNLQKSPKVVELGSRPPKLCDTERSISKEESFFLLAFGMPMSGENSHM